MLLEVRTLPTGTLAWFVKTAGVSGVVSQARVVTLKLRVTAPKVIVTDAAVPHVAAAVTRRVTAWPGFTTPGALVNVPPSMLYSPPVTEIAVPASIPVSRMAFDVTTDPRARPERGVKSIAVGSRFR